MAGLGDIEGYIRDKGVEAVFKQMLVTCFKARPDDPVEFMCVARPRAPPRAPRAA